MSYYSTMENQDRSRYNDWNSKIQQWAGQAMGKVPEWSDRFTDPTEFAKAVAENMLSSTDAYRYTTPGYRDFLVQAAPEAYALQQMMAMGRYGGPAGPDFPEFFKNWMSPNIYGKGNYGFGGLPRQEMMDLWREFTNSYNQMLGGDTSKQYLSALSPQDLQSFQELALKSGYSPFGQKLLGRYLDEAYYNWANFTKATPWIQFLNTVNPGGSGSIF